MPLNVPVQSFHEDFVVGLSEKRPPYTQVLNTWSFTGGSVWGIVWNLWEEWSLVERPGHWQWASRSYSLVLLAAVLYVSYV